MIFGKKQQETRERTMIEARAKINLTLDVTGKREDGYHLVKMVMQSVDLHDDVRVTIVRGEKKPRGIVLSCSMPFLPTDSSNLAYRAAELFYKETGVPLETCEIFIEKRIPIAAGLAGDGDTRPTRLPCCARSISCMIPACRATACAKWASSSARTYRTA